MKKETPLKYCHHCKKKLERRKLKRGDYESWKSFEKKKYCNRECMKKAFKEKPKKRQKDLSIRYSRAKAQRLLPMSLCEVCQKKPSKDVHHKDENPLNNSLNNLMRVCRSCHLKIHRPKSICKVESCNTKMKGLGYCEKHYQRFKKYGNPLMVKNNQFSKIIELDD